MDKKSASAPSQAAYQSAAECLGCDVAAIKAVAEVEAGPQGAFLPSGLPTILFEPHIFDRLTGGKFRGQVAPASLLKGPPAVLSREHWAPGTYGPTSAQYIRLSAASRLSLEDAMKATSWGMFQLLGENHSRCGFATVREFVNAMYRDADAHLLAFATFVRANSKLIEALVSHDWKTFARLYNGAAYARNKYDKKLAAAYKSLANSANQERIS